MHPIFGRLNPGTYRDEAIGSMRDCNYPIGAIREILGKSRPLRLPTSILSEDLWPPVTRRADKMPARIRELDFLARRISYLAPSAAILRRRCQTDTIRPYYHKTIVSESHARKRSSPRY